MEFTSGIKKITIERKKNYRKISIKGHGSFAIKNKEYDQIIRDLKEDKGGPMIATSQYGDQITRLTIQYLFTQNKVLFGISRYCCGKQIDIQIKLSPKEFKSKIFGVRREKNHTNLSQQKSNTSTCPRSSDDLLWD